MIKDKKILRKNIFLIIGLSIGPLLVGILLYSVIFVLLGLIFFILNGVNIFSQANIENIIDLSFIAIICWISGLVILIGFSIIKD